MCLKFILKCNTKILPSHKPSSFIESTNTICTEKLWGMGFGWKQFESKFHDIKTMFLDFKNLVTLTQVFDPRQKLLILLLTGLISF